MANIPPFLAEILPVIIQALEKDAEEVDRRAVDCPPPAPAAALKAGASAVRRFTPPAAMD